MKWVTNNVPGRESGWHLMCLYYRVSNTISSRICSCMPRR